MSMPNLSRRTFLKSSTGLAACSLIPLPTYGVVTRNPKFSAYPFACGVASGDPSSSGVVLWTRLAPKPLAGGGMPDEDVEVSWKIANDERMTKVVRKGTAVASPNLAHTVHIEAEGLEPNRGYFYQFKSGNETSPVGRTKTAPAPGSSLDRLRFAFASCQHYESGLYTAYEHMAKQPLDLVIHLGDYIYQDPASEGSVRKHVGPELVTLADYRNRHAQYKTDKHLQATHLAFPWLVTWDDHEVDNNYADEDCQHGDFTVEEFLKRRAAAYQAYYEHMPLRRRSIPNGPDMQLYRRVRYGDLADFFVLDTRQYRSNQACGGGNITPCPEVADPDRTMLGSRQQHWLEEGLAKSASNWNVLAQSVMFAPADRDTGEKVRKSMEQWPGYEANRRRLLSFFDEAKIRNPMIITGDIHSNWANDINLPDDGPTVATEYVGTSISSSGNGGPRTEYAEGVMRDNPFVKFYNAQRGFVQCEVTPDHWHSDYQIVENVTEPGAPLVTLASFVTESEKPGVQKA